ncbi:DUF4274 domain-containing protein [Paenibacillus spongiae]|uniref:DUF4274 domain-containing protein n=1 Tax=Paenibacillus spongiae TaxID=2909671 RepID=A0ABY5SKY6_9BACL|nr:DUF4274 domain-containing protein [Paenibacillus spongiae]UVI32908.1 DUF4274 domain-containing protein [Paenibacillus spongiae]
MSLFEAIKNKSIIELIAVINQCEPDDLNVQDALGRTPLHYVITQKAPIELLAALLEHGANPELQDKLGLTVLQKAIKFGNLGAVDLLLSRGVEFNHPAGIMHTYWFQARHYPLMADKMLATEGSLRLTLTRLEKSVIEEAIYAEHEERMALMSKLDTPELLHAFVLHFNWDDAIEPLKVIIDHPECKEITAYEMFDLLEGDYWLKKENVAQHEREYLELANAILARFPRVGGLGK